MDAILNFFGVRRSLDENPQQNPPFNNNQSPPVTTFQEANPGFVYPGKFVNPEENINLPPDVKLVPK